MSTEIQSGNIFIRKMGPLNAGGVIQGHRHNFDHTTIVFSGTVRVRAKVKVRAEDGSSAEEVVERVFAAPDHFLVLADVEHELTAMEDGSIFWCVYSHRTSQGEVIQRYDGFMEAYL